MDINATDAADGMTLSADVCIVGGGPVGLVLANELQRLGREVVLLESGDQVGNADAQDLSAGAIHGALGRDLQDSRCRAVGGTAHTWNTMAFGARHAKFVPLDDIDFTARDWVPMSGWSITGADVRPYYPRAVAACGLPVCDYRASTWADADHPRLGLDQGTLTDGVFLCGPADRFCREFPAMLREATGVAMVRGATVTSFSRSSSDRIVAANWTTPSGRRGTVHAARFVLAAGGIESARILLLQQRARGREVAASSWLGCGFMDHPHDTSLELMSRAPALMANPGFYTTHQTPQGVIVMGRLAVSTEVQRELRIANASVRLVNADEMRRLDAEVRMADWNSLAGRAARKVARLLRQQHVAARRRTAGARFRIIIDLEQAPHHDNRVTLTDQVDRFGQPRAQLHWRWHDEDQASRVRIHDLIKRELEQAGFGRVYQAHDRPLEPETHHHVGVTRMHADPAVGVVDTTSRVHGEENLFVAGSAVFPTAGFANPTLTALALTLRLADYLSTQ